MIYKFLQPKNFFSFNRHPSITIHGLGAAIQKSINLVLALNDLTHNQIIYKTTTSTVQLVDDIIPDDDVSIFLLNWFIWLIFVSLFLLFLFIKDKDLYSQTRQNSAVHIQVSLKEDVKKYVLNKNNLPPVKRWYIKSYVTW